MTRLEGQKPNTGAIIIGAVIFALIAAGLFFAFRPVPEPTDAGLSNSADSANSAADANAAADSANSAADANAADANATDANATSDESANSLTTILTPLPLATPGAISENSASNAVADNAATGAVAASNEATANQASANGALSNEAAPATNSVAAPGSP